MLIYKITSPNTDLVYVGKTIRTLKWRFDHHHSHYKRWLVGKPKISNCGSFKVLEHGDATIELIEKTDDASREYHWIRELNACNERWGLYDAAAYHKVRYAEKKEEICARKRQREPCSNCGRVLSHGYMTIHQKTKSCQNHSV